MTLHNLPHFYFLIAYLSYGYNKGYLIFCETSFSKIQSYQLCPTLHNFCLWLRFSFLKALQFMLILIAWSMINCQNLIFHFREQKRTGQIYWALSLFWLIKKMTSMLSSLVSGKSSEQRVYKLSKTGSQTPGPRWSWLAQGERFQSTFSWT